MVRTCFRSGLPWAIHRDLDGLVVRRDLRRVRRYGDRQRERLPWNEISELTGSNCTRATHIVISGYLFSRAAR